MKSDSKILSNIRCLAKSWDPIEEDLHKSYVNEKSGKKYSVSQNKANSFSEMAHNWTNNSHKSNKGDDHATAAKQHLAAAFYQHHAGDKVAAKEHVHSAIHHHEEAKAKGGASKRTMDWVSSKMPSTKKLVGMAKSEEVGTDLQKAEHPKTGDELHRGALKTKVLHHEDHPHGHYHVEDHGASVHGVFFTPKRARKPQYIGTAMNLDAAKAHIKHHAKSHESETKKAEPLSKPPVSEDQRKAMGAAASGHSTLGIPKSVGKEFIDADKGGKLPEHHKKAEKDDVGYWHKKDHCPVCGEKVKGDMKAHVDSRHEFEMESRRKNPDDQALKLLRERGVEKGELEKVAYSPTQQMESHASQAATAAGKPGFKLPVKALKMPTPAQHADRAAGFADFMPPATVGHQLPHKALGKSEFGNCALCGKPEHLKCS